MPKRLTPYTGRAYLSVEDTSAQAVSTGGSDTTLTGWTAETEKERITWNATTGVATIDTAQSGDYRIVYTVRFEPNATGERRCFISINDIDSVKYGGSTTEGTTVSTLLTGSAVIPLVGTNTIRLKVYQNSGGDLDCGGTGSLRNFLQIYQLF
jgi:hypothetical protein